MTTNEFWTLFIAVYAAVISSIVLAWDVIKWAVSGPRLRIVCQPGVILVGKGVRDTQRKISAVVVNRGDAATTLTNLHLCKYESRWQSLLPWIKPAYYFVKEPSALQRLPFSLAAGGQWHGLINQSAELETMMRDGALFAEIHYVHSNSGLRSARLRLHELEGAAAP